MEFLFVALKRFDQSIHDIVAVERNVSGTLFFPLDPLRSKVMTHSGHANCECERGRERGK